MYSDVVMEVGKKYFEKLIDEMKEKKGVVYDVDLTADDLKALASFASRSGFDKVFYADPHRGESCFECPDLYKRSLIIIGGEANGSTDLPQGTRSVQIPMPGNYESLNAAQAATVLLVEYVRRITAQEAYQRR